MSKAGKRLIGAAREMRDSVKPRNKKKGASGAKIINGLQEAVEMVRSSDVIYGDPSKGGGLPATPGLNSAVRALIARLDAADARQEARDRADRIRAHAPILLLALRDIYKMKPHSPQGVHARDAIKAIGEDV